MAMGGTTASITPKMLRYLVPFIRKEFVSDVERSHGFLGLPPELHPFLTSTVWANLYEDRKKITSLLPTIFIRLHPKAEQAELRGLKADEAAQLVSSINQMVLDNFEDGVNPLGIDDTAWPPTEDAVAEFGKLSFEEQEEAFGTIKILVCFMMTQVSTFLALLSFGQTMCDLVAKAKEGDDDAFCKAVQIDRTVLFGVPYFQQRLIRAQAGYEPKFLHNLANALKKPPLGKKLRHPMLMVVFYILDDSKLLNMPLEPLLDLCEELGLAGPGTGITDTDGLGKRRQYYYRMTGRQT